MGIKATEQELTLLDLNTTEGGTTLDIILTNLYLLGNSDAGDALNLYQALMGAKTMDDAEPDQTEADDDYEFVSDLYKVDVLAQLNGKRKKAALSKFVKSKRVLTTKTKLKPGDAEVIALVQQGINELYELGGLDAPLVVDGTLGGNTSKAIEAITSYFTALDHVEALGKVTGLETPAKDLFSQEGASDGVSADLVILLDQLLYLASIKPKDPTVDTRPVDNSFKTITQRAEGLDPMKRDDSFYRALTLDDHVEEFRYIFIDSDMDYYSHEVAFVEYRVNRVLTAIFVVSNQEKLQEQLEDGKTTFRFKAASDEAAEKATAAWVKVKTAEEAVAAAKTGSQEAQDAVDKFRKVKAKAREDRINGQDLLIAEQDGKSVGQYRLPIYQSIENDLMNFTSVAFMKRKFVMDDGNPRSLFRIVGTTDTNSPANEVGKDWESVEAYAIEFARDPDNPGQIETRYGGDLLKGKRERVVANMQNTGYVEPKGLEEHALVMPNRGEIKHFEHTKSGFGKDPVNLGEEKKSNQNGPDRFLVINLDNPFGDEVALVRKADLLYVGLRSSKELPFIFYTLHSKNASGVNAVLDAGKNEVLLTRNQNRLVFHKQKLSEVSQEDEILQINTIIDGSEAGKRSISIYLGDVAYNWDAIFNTVIKEQVISQQLRGVDLFGPPRMDMDPYQDKGLVNGQKADERRLQEQGLDAYQFLKQQPSSTVGEKLKIARQNLPKAFRAAANAFKGLSLPGNSRFTYLEVSDGESDTKKLKHFKKELKRLQKMNPNYSRTQGYQFKQWQRAQGGYLDFLVKQFESLVKYHALIERKTGENTTMHQVSAVFYSEAAPYIPIPINLHLVEKDGLFYLAYRNEVDSSEKRFYNDGEEVALKALKDGLTRLDKDAILGKGHLFVHLSDLGDSSGSYSFEFNNPWENFNKFLGTVMMVGVGVLLAAAAIGSGGILGPVIVGGMVAAGTAATTVTGIYFAIEAADRLAATSGRSWSDVGFDFVDILGGAGGLISAFAKFAKAGSTAAKYKGGIGKMGEGVEAASNALALISVGVKVGVEGKDFDAIPDLMNILAGVAEGMKFFFKRIPKGKAKVNPNPNTSHPKMWDATKPNEKLLAEVDSTLEGVFKGMNSDEQAEYLMMLNSLSKEEKLRFSALIDSLKKSPDLQVTTVKKVMKTPPKGKNYGDNLESVITLYTKPYLFQFNKKKKRKAKEDFNKSLDELKDQEIVYREMQVELTAREKALADKKGQISTAEGEHLSSSNDYKTKLEDYKRNAKELKTEQGEWATSLKEKKGKLDDTLKKDEADWGVEKQKNVDDWEKGVGPREKGVEKTRSEIKAREKRIADADGKTQGHQNAVDKAAEELVLLREKSAKIKRQVDELKTQLDELEQMKKDYEMYEEAIAIEAFKQKHFKNKNIKGGVREVENAIGAGKEGAKYRKLRGRIQSKRDQLLQIQKERIKDERSRNTQMADKGQYKASDKEAARLRSQIIDMERELKGLKIHPQMEEFENLVGDRIYRQKIDEKQLAYDDAMKDYHLSQNPIEEEMGVMVENNRKKTRLSQETNEVRVENALQKDQLKEQLAEQGQYAQQGEALKQSQYKIDDQLKADVEGQRGLLNAADNKKQLGFGGRENQLTQDKTDLGTAKTDLDTLAIKIAGWKGQVSGLDSAVGTQKKILTGQEGLMDKSIKTSIKQLEKVMGSRTAGIGLEEILSGFDWIEFFRTVTLFKDVRKATEFDFWLGGGEDAAEKSTQIKDEMGEALSTILAAEANLATASKDITAILKLIPRKDLKKVPLLFELVSSYETSVRGYRSARINIIMGLFRLANPNELAMQNFLHRVRELFDHDPEKFNPNLSLPGSEQHKQSIEELPENSPMRANREAEAILSEKFKDFYPSIIAKHKH